MKPCGSHSIVCETSEQNKLIFGTLRPVPDVLNQIDEVSSTHCQFRMALLVWNGKKC